jgi:Uma2 family endonuclease
MLLTPADDHGRGILGSRTAGLIDWRHPIETEGLRLMATDARLTAQALLRLGGDDIRRELVNGRVIEMPPHGFPHGEIVGRVCRRLVEHVEPTRAGRVVAGDIGFVLNVPGDPERVRAPDVAYVSLARLPEGRRPEGFMMGAPDLAVEVLSPSDAVGDIQQKVRDYLDAGARLIWLIAPESRTATVYRADGSARLLRDPDTLDGEDVLPGLSIRLSDLFED